MTALFRHRTPAETCSALSDAGGAAECSIIISGGAAGRSARHDACFSLHTRLYCAGGSFTPR